ncbi:MAG: Fic family protein [Planctomycetota bacterium]|nr:Fic family protein [Planctomycetota bacterium]
MRTYEQTHPWLNFGLDLNRFTSGMWMSLGEAKSKCEHVAGVPLRPDLARKMSLISMAKGIHATTSIEGNTLTEEEVARRIDKKLELPESREYLGREVDNLVGACNRIATEIDAGFSKPLNVDRIKEYHRVILSGLNVPEDVRVGEFRTYSVGVARYRGAPAEDCEYLVDRLCSWLSGPEFKSDQPQLAFALVIIKAILAHLYIAWIHPFGDGNGRVARLVELEILVQSGLIAFPSGHLLSNFYNRTRGDYYLHLDRASKSPDGVTQFIAYAVGGFVDELREEIDMIKNQFLQYSWENYVHEQFRGQDTTAAHRRRHLALDLSDRGVVPRKKLTLITPRTARDYARCGEKTLTRDLNKLVEMNLVVSTPRGYQANRAMMLAFLPRRAESTVS